jgi:hypothetical protein
MYKTKILEIRLGDDENKYGFSSCLYWSNGNGTNMCDPVDHVASRREKFIGF